MVLSGGLHTNGPRPGGFRARLERLAHDLIGQARQDVPETEMLRRVNAGLVFVLRLLAVVGLFSPTGIRDLGFGEHSEACTEKSFPIGAFPEYLCLGLSAGKVGLHGAYVANLQAAHMHKNADQNIAIVSLK